MVSENRCSLPASPLQLPEELQLLHRSADGAVSEVDTDVVVKSGVIGRETSCEEDEVFQMIPEPQTPPETESEQDSAALVEGVRQDEAVRSEQTGGSNNARNGHVELSSSVVEVAVSSTLTTTRTPIAETESDLVVGAAISHLFVSLAVCHWQ